MKSKSSAILLAALMCTASMLGFAARPSAKAVDKGKVVVLDAIVPKAFGEWSEYSGQTAQLVNPQTQALIDSLYSQTLSRIYVDQQGYRIMLSLAYGDDQRGGLQAHKPEVCYPAQGFSLISSQEGMLPTAFGDIQVRRLSTTLGNRAEPVTYWLTVGDQVIGNRFEKRLAEIRLGLTGQIPDGLLFRISSIDRDTAHAFAMHQRFAEALMGAVPAGARKQLSGLNGDLAPKT
jgi:EpsI family protein